MPMRIQHSTPLSDALFQEEVNSNSITLHYTLQNPDNYGISNPSFLSEIIPFLPLISVLLPKIILPNWKTSLMPNSLLQSDHLETFRGFLLQHSVRNSISVIRRTHQPSYRYSDTTSYFIIRISICWYHRCGTYLALLKTLPEHFDSLTGFETSKADAGLFGILHADSVIKECNTFLNMGSSNYLYSSFEDRINNLSGCSADTKKAYIAQNESCTQRICISRLSESDYCIGNIKIQKWQFRWAMPPSGR